MLSNIVFKKGVSLTFRNYQTIVFRHQGRKSLFDKTSYNSEWIPREKPYHKERKPRMQIWNDTKNVGPYQIPPLRQSINYRKYVQEVVESELRQKSMRSKQYLLEVIRPGDIVEITYQQTFESDATTTHQGFVTGFKRRNQLTASLEVVIRLGGMNIKASYMIHSPKVKNIQVVSKGSGNLRNNLKQNWIRMNKDDATKARIRNRVMKSRTGTKIRQKKRVIPVVNYDNIQSDNVKRIIKKDL